MSSRPPSRSPLPGHKSSGVDSGARAGASPGAGAGTRPGQGTRQPAWSTTTARTDCRCPSPWSSRLSRSFGPGPCCGRGHRPTRGRSWRSTPTGSTRRPAWPRRHRGTCTATKLGGIGLPAIPGLRGARTLLRTGLVILAGPQRLRGARTLFRTGLGKHFPKGGHLHRLRGARTLLRTGLGKHQVRRQGQ